ncbi:MAG: DUF952 domain-containing protein [Kordiimonadaceae bacterium]|jgi:uncharacterized protein (DUF952 family)|nr:DUF952 domain-containing protein [Kordiimonadaceae bacterium]MBT6036643.1 DUF952 domain-containing protein [Kordiimonadaceae bacterium]MBT6329549.1 DUF952 domain-containing protein [Kordiimonadaceae bacterium]MBT7582642.1 DUF952 domain-containing protein [Kordiimonadaceae bacterium]
MFEVDVIYKICPKDEWENAGNLGVYKGSQDDLRDGFIHFSSFDQVLGTLDKHFVGQKDLLLLKVSMEQLDPAQLKWETSRNDEKFPHLYGDLNLDAVINVVEIADER